MGHRKQSAPRHGSLRYMPRKRAAYIKGRIRKWSDIKGDVQFLGFAGFKAGMTHINFIMDQKSNPFFGKELMKAVTIIETPPLIMIGIKVYKRDEYGLRCIGELLSKNLPKELNRKLSLPKPEKYNFKLKKTNLIKQIEDNCEIRGLFITQPKKAGLPRIKPDVIEIKVSGGANAIEQFNFALKYLGKELRIMDCFKEGEIIDVIAVTKGKGFQGPVKRFGIKMLPRKTRGTIREVGCIGPWHPARVMYTVPRAGQMGFHQRVEFNKRIMKMGENGEEINPKGGFINYGIVKNDYIMVLGSVPGPKKRLIRLRKPIRLNKNYDLNSPEITYISRESQQKK
ncbi:MAG: 50S ribosomal protein L3 [Promethearchaeota archaeon]